MSNKNFLYYIVNIYDPGSVLGFGNDWELTFTKDEDFQAAHATFEKAEKVLEYVKKTNPTIIGSFMPGIIAKEIRS